MFYYSRIIYVFLVVLQSTVVFSATKEVDGFWDHVVSLRDRSTLYPSIPGRPKPEGGWYVTPINATVLGNGEVLINGWGRFDPSNCKIHRTRQYGESFVLKPSLLTGVPTNSVYPNLNPLSEKARPRTETNTRGEVAPDVLYCSGHAPLPDGRVLFVGGARYEYLGNKIPPDPASELEYGLNYSRLFDPLRPADQQFSRLDAAPLGSPKKQPGQEWYQEGMMWYPTVTRLPDGKLLVTGGLTRKCPEGQSCPNRDLEIFDYKKLRYFNPKIPSTTPWSTLLASANAPDLYDPGLKDYTHSILLPTPVYVGGRLRQVALMGWKGIWALLSTDPGVPDQQRIVVQNRTANSEGAQRPENSGALSSGAAGGWDSSAALVSTGELLTVGGGGPANQRDKSPQRIDLYSPVTGKWRSVETGVTRHNPVATLLPDGKVLIINGERGDGQNNEIGGDPFALGNRHQPQIFDPENPDLKKSVVSLAAWDDLNPADRGYHSFSVLLKDGRVMLGGGMVGLGQVGCERTDLRIFSPPYLFKGPRPVILQQISPSSNANEPYLVKLGQTLTVNYQGPRLREVGGAVLMALGSETHSFDQNQRYVRLKLKSQENGRAVMEVPMEASKAPEGDYFLFLLSEAGVPSTAKLVRLSSRTCCN